MYRQALLLVSSAIQCRQGHREADVPTSGKAKATYNLSGYHTEVLPPPIAPFRNFCRGGPRAQCARVLLVRHAARVQGVPRGELPVHRVLPAPCRFVLERTQAGVQVAPAEGTSPPAKTWHWRRWKRCLGR